jgi:hypothetical protein
MNTNKKKDEEANKQKQYEYKIINFPIDGHTLQQRLAFLLGPQLSVCVLLELESQQRVDEELVGRVAHLVVALQAARDELHELRVFDPQNAGRFQALRSENPNTIITKKRERKRERERM